MIETLIAQSNLLSEAQKNVHLIYASALKYMRDFVYEEDLFDNGTPHPVGLPTWEDYYSDCLHDNLTDWDDNPVGTFMNHIAIPEVLVECAGYATWQILTRDE